MNVTEGPPTLVTSSTVQDGKGVLTAKEITRELRPEVGKPLNLLALDSATVRLRSLLWERGYADATLDAAASRRRLTRPGIRDDRSRREAAGDRSATSASPATRR